MWKDSIRNIVVIFQTNILRIVGFYVRRSAIEVFVISGKLNLSFCQFKCAVMVDMVIHMSKHGDKMPVKEIVVELWHMRRKIFPILLELSVMETNIVDVQRKKYQTISARPISRIAHFFWLKIHEHKWNSRNDSTNVKKPTWHT